MPPTSFEPSSRETQQARRASLAVGVAPPTVLLSLLAVVAGWIEPDTGLLLFVTGVAWTVYEMHRYLRLVDTAIEPEVRHEDLHQAR